MMRNLTLRRTDERDEIIERLRKKLKKSGRNLETIHGMVTTAAIFDEALKALERELDKDHIQ